MLHGVVVGYPCFGGPRLTLYSPIKTYSNRIKGLFWMWK